MNVFEADYLRRVQEGRREVEEAHRKARADVCFALARFYMMTAVFTPCPADAVRAMAKCLGYQMRGIQE